MVLRPLVQVMNYRVVIMPTCHNKTSSERANTMVSELVGWGSPPKRSLIPINTSSLSKKGKIIHHLFSFNDGDLSHNVGQEMTQNQADTEQ